MVVLGREDSTAPMPEEVLLWRALYTVLSRYTWEGQADTGDNEGFAQSWIG